MVTVLAPAKLNLGLRVLDRRPDGYHEIETVYLPLRLYDRLELEPRPEPGIVLEGGLGSEVPTDATNLAVQAAAEVTLLLGGPAGLRIRLHKEIPVAAGLGGGSSDAAAVILGLETLRGSHLSPADRHALARKLGADVAFFLSPRPSIGRGIGDRLEPLSGLPEMWWVLVVFPFGLSTREIYEETSRELTLPQGGSRIAPLLGSSGVRESAPNDLEKVATRQHPEIGAVRRVLEQVGASVTGMSGSGPTVYGRFGSREAAEQVARTVGLPAGARTLVASSPGSDSESWGWGVAKG